MNIDSVYFKKKDIVNSRDAFNKLEKIRLEAKPTKKVLILDQSNIPPDTGSGARAQPESYVTTITK